jgi:YebC/PmpR family DNA-binding regulatory protein
MSGHSKWSKIKHQKKAEDKKRSKIFSKLSEAISRAVKEGGGDDPEFNPRLKMEIEKAKEANMPKENIQSAVDRGAGKGEYGKTESFVYEGFAPHKVAVVVKCVTDNRNRTASELKYLFEKNGGSLGSPGSSSYLFEEKGILVLKKEGNGEEQILRLMDLEIEDYQLLEDTIKIYIQPQKLNDLKKQVENEDFKIISSRLVLLPKSKIKLEAKVKKEVKKLLRTLKEHSDVQLVFNNLEK